MSGTTMNTGMGTSAVPVTDETGDLIASDKVEGTAVYNRQREHMGTVKNFMVNKRSGQVAYAVMSFGGFLGMGESYHPLPWKVLTYDTGMGRLRRGPHPPAARGRAELHQQRHAGLVHPDLRPPGQRLLRDAVSWRLTGFRGDPGAKPAGSPILGFRCL